MDINSFINSFDKESVRKLGNIVNTPAGQNLIKKLKNVDKNELLRRISSIDKGDMPKEELIRQFTDDPELIKKLNNILDRK